MYVRSAGGGLGVCVRDVDGMKQSWAVGKTARLCRVVETK